MFNNISRKKLFHIIEEDYTELPAFTHILYDSPGKVHYRWEDGSWLTISMEEGVNQGCPLSSLFATLVLLRIICPLNVLMADLATPRLTNNYIGDNH